ncbi:hypothetical protein [Methylobacter sp.]|jgi:hypothetical protein
MAAQEPNAARNCFQIDLIGLNIKIRSVVGWIDKTGISKSPMPGFR